jgi:hypothetical protein
MIGLGILFIFIFAMDLEYNAAHKKVAYFYNPIISKFVYAKEHPMRPERIAMAHNLIVNTGLYKYLLTYPENWMFIMRATPVNKKWPDSIHRITLITSSSMLVKTFPTSSTVLALISMRFPKIKRPHWNFWRKNKNSKSGNQQTVPLSMVFIITAKFLQALQSILQHCS